MVTRRFEMASDLQAVADSISRSQEGVIPKVRVRSSGPRESREDRPSSTRDSSFRSKNSCARNDAICLG